MSRRDLQCTCWDHPEPNKFTASKTSDDQVVACNVCGGTAHVTHKVFDNYTVR